MTNIAYKETRYISVADTAKLVRKALKENFVGIKFSVRSNSYSMGASIDIEWNDGPTTKAVDAVVDQFKGADFDGMEDMKVYRKNYLNDEEVHFGADYIHTHRNLSVELVTTVAKAYCDRYSHEMPEIKVSCGSAYIDTWHQLRDNIMPLAYDCDGSEVEGFALCISDGKLVIKRANTVVDVPCECCHIYTCPEKIQTINNKPVCHFCIEQDMQDLTPEDTELPLEMEVAQIMTQVEEATSIPLAKVIDIQTRQPVTKQPQVSTTRQPQVQKGELVKTEVLDVLKQGYTESNRYYLPNIRLERKLYVAVNEVLERIGGKWNKKSKAHIFEDVEPAPLLELIFESGEMPPKNPTAFFPTPASVVDYLLTDGGFYRIPSDAKRILEPSAGKGNIAEGIRAYCHQHQIDATLDCCEILPRFQDQLKAKGFNVIDEPDFLAYQPTYQYDAIIANPPFSVDGDPLAYITHIEHAWSLLVPGGTLSAVVPAGFISRDDKRVKKLRKLVEDHGTWRELKRGSFADSGTGVNTAIISMRK